MNRPNLNEEALFQCRQVGDRLGLAEALNQRGAVSLYTCDFSHARACFGESLALLSLSGRSDYFAVRLPVRVGATWRF